MDNLPSGHTGLLAAKIESQICLKKGLYFEQ